MSKGNVIQGNATFCYATLHVACMYVSVQHGQENMETCTQCHEDLQLQRSRIGSQIELILMDLWVPCFCLKAAPQYFFGSVPVNSSLVFQHCRTPGIGTDKDKGTGKHNKAPKGCSMGELIGPSWLTYKGAGKGHAPKGKGKADCKGKHAAQGDSAPHPCMM